jgi:hypothetical protein
MRDYTHHKNISFLIRFRLVDDPPNGGFIRK